jgi:hypothetical protein
MKIQVSKPGPLVFVFIDHYRLEVFGFKYLAAIQTLDVIHAVPPCQDHRTFMLAKGLHIKQNS